MTSPHSPTAKADGEANNLPFDGWTFRAPRHADLTACPVCFHRPDDDYQTCGFCGDEGSVFRANLETVQ